MLSENKMKMLKEHKDQCFATIQEIQETHDIFWDRLRETRARRKQEWENRRSERAENINANIYKNKSTLTSAAGALERVTTRIAEIEDKISETTSEKWVQIYGEWLSEAEAKRDSILELIERIRQWIEQDEERLKDIYRGM